MDGKALAKSKRAHSLHHKKKNQTQHGFKAPSVASSGDKKQANAKPQQSEGQKTKERPPQYQGSRGLPSNWDRYDNDLDLASEGAQASSSQPTEFVVPKSKGSDYAYLISEAKDQSQSNVLPSFDDFISDFTQDFAPMLAAKGQNMLSWITDDSFELEGMENTSIEAPFLSLNVNILAEQLSKAKLSERLYLQSDLLPLELLDDIDTCEEDKHDRQTYTSAAETNTGSSSLGYNQGVSKIVQHREPGSSTITATGDLLVQTYEEESNPVKQNRDEILQSQEINKSNSAKPVSEPALDTTGKPSTFEAASAEAELDMLLNSFDETMSSSIGIPSNAMKKGTYMMEPVSNPVNIDDAIDYLLEETSSLTVVNEQISQVPNAYNEAIPSSINPISETKILDDFDSWLDTI